MDTANQEARQDRPIESLDADILDRGPFVSSLIKALIHNETDKNGNLVTQRSTGFVIGLTGEWGLGKSSIINLLRKELTKTEGTAVAYINPWLFKGRDELIQAYFNSLREALGRSPTEKARALQEQLERYKKSIEIFGTATAAALDALGGNGAVSSLWNKFKKNITELFTKPKPLSAEHERKSLEKKLEKFQTPVIVLIDELDRVEDEEVRAVAQLIKAVGDIKGVSYLVAYDPERVTQALGRGENIEERKKSGEQYLEKIIQFPIPLRPLFTNDISTLISANLQNAKINIPNPLEEHQEAIINQITLNARTPREIKRLIGTFSVLHEILHREICPYDILGYSWIITKTPATREAIARNIDAIVDDPSQLELIKRVSQLRENKNNPPPVKEILGPQSEGHSKLIEILFPYFINSGSSATGNRISKRRNLVRLLYLGNSPGMMSIREIEKVWNLDTQEAMKAELHRLLDDGLLPSLVDRLAELLPELSTEGDKIFWPSLSKILVRKHDWITEEESIGNYVDDAGAAIWLYAVSNRNGKSRAKKIIEVLIENDDLLITPWLLRKHLFAYNLTPYERQNNGECILNLEETKILLEKELPRYRNAVLNETALRRLTDTEAIYCITNSKQWDSTLRESLTKQLNNMSAIATFAALTVRPGYGSDYNAMNELLDAGLVLRNIKKIVSEEGIPQNDWLAVSVERLQVTLDGKDPNDIQQSPISP